MTNERLSKPFTGFDSIDERMERVPLDLRDDEIREEYLNNHVQWFLQHHNGSKESSMKNPTKKPKTSIASVVEVKPDFSEMAAKWPSAFVSRDKSDEFTGGIIKPRYLANLDSVGQGPPGKIRCGRKIAYPVTEFVKWLEERSKVAI